MMRRGVAFTFAILALTLVAPGPVSAAGRKPITICGTTWGKLGGDHLPGKGFVPDLVMRVFRHAGYEIRTELVPWPRCVEQAKRRKYDLISSAWRGPNFEPHFDYLNVILHDTINFVTVEGSPHTLGDMESFYGRSVGLVREAGGLEALFDGHPQIKVHGVAQLKKLPQMLVRGRFDAIVSDPVSLNELVKGMKPAFTHKLVAPQPPLKINYNSPMIAKDHEDKDAIMADFDRAYRELRAKGLYDDLIRIHDLQVQYPKD